MVTIIGWASVVFLYLLGIILAAIFRWSDDEEEIEDGFLLPHDANGGESITNADERPGRLKTFLAMLALPFLLPILIVARLWEPMMTLAFWIGIALLIWLLFRSFF